MMAMDVNPQRHELMTISAGSYALNNNNMATTTTTTNNNNNSNNSNNNNNNNNNSTRAAAPPSGCCGLLGRLLCSSRRNKTANVTSGDADNFNALMLAPTGAPPSYASLSLASTASLATTTTTTTCQQQQRKTQTARRRTPQEIYFESRGKSCKKLLKFNGSSNKILLYPEEGWARTASSSYWTITPCWWQPNRCRIEEFSGTQRQATRAKMLPLEQKGALLIAGHFRRANKNGYSNGNGNGSGNGSGSKSSDKNDVGSNEDEFKLYLTSNISMEDYNMGYCLTGFVERRCQQTNTFQMTHFAVIKRQWPAMHGCGNGSGGSGGGGGGVMSGCRSRSESKST